MGGSGLKFFKTLCQVSAHLRDARLTRLLGQFIEVHKSQFFQILEILIRDCIALLFPTAL